MDKSLLGKALEAHSESAAWDFKQSFTPSSDAEWLEIIKDVVAMANSGGGIIVFGLRDNGIPVGCDTAAITAIDPAHVTDKVHKYTGTHFAAFNVIRCQKNDVELCAIEIGEVDYPLAFQKVGNHALPDSKQKTVFSQGTVYFRHGAKSEPGNTADFRAFVDRRIEALRSTWMSNIRTVIEAPTGSLIAVLPSHVRLSSAPDAQPVRLTNEKAVQMFQATFVDDTHPYRQKEALREINRRLDHGASLNPHDLLCIRRAHNIQRDLKYCYNLNWSSPRYSSAFVDWIVEEMSRSPDFVTKARAAYTHLKGAKKWQSGVRDGEESSEAV